MTRRRWTPGLLVCALMAVLTLAGCSTDEDPGPPAATATATTEQTTTTTSEPLTPEEEVEAAYLRSWQVFAAAMLELDSSRLSEVFAGDQLDRATQEVDAQATDGRPIKVEVDHELSISFLTDDHVVVKDRYRNHSVYLDPETLEPTESDPDVEYVELTTLRREVGGKWMVVHILRESPSP